MKKNKLLLVGLIAVLASTQIAVTSPNVSSYDPWLDLNDDGIIDVNDLQILALIYSTSGTPINKTELLLELQDRIDSLNASLLADYFNKIDSDVRFVNVLGDTMTGALYVPIVYDKDNSAYYVNPAGGTSALFAGDVGIGTTTPAARLHVTGGTGGVRGEGSSWGGSFADTDGSSYALLAYAGYGVYCDSNYRGIQARGDTCGGLFQCNGGTGQATLAFGDYGIYTQGTRNSFSGDVGIGTLFPEQKLHVEGPIRWDGLDDYEFTFREVYSGSDYIECYSAEEGTYVGIQYFISTRDSKKNFQPLSEVVDSNKIYDLEPLSFHYKSDPDDARKSIGLVAEDTAEVLPEIVSYDDDGNPHHINYGLLAVLNLDQLQKIRKGITVDEDGKVGIGDIIFQEDGEKLWRMFEDADGLYLENLKTGKVYSFVLQEVDGERLVESDNSYLKPSGLHINAATGLAGLVIALGVVLGLTRYKAKNSKEETDAQQTTLSQWQ